MASDTRWIRLKVSLVSGRGGAFEPAPGRVMIAAPEHTLAAFAEAIDLGFARWIIRTSISSGSPTGAR